jgi:hypothetical protein
VPCLSQPLSIVPAVASRGFVDQIDLLLTLVQRGVDFGGAVVVGDSEKPDVRALVEQLSRGVEQLGDEGKWEQFLAAQARFHRYSFANTMLILQQLPDATTVAGFNTWRGMGRAVRRGERAIWIVAPVLERSGRSSSEREIAGFRRVAVFDLSQTEGTELVSLCEPLEGNDDRGWFSALAEVASALDFEVERTELATGVYGDCTYVTRRIRIATTASPAQAVKTLAHELAHALLHENTDDRPLAELEAESVAYIVCAHLGLDTKRYSFGYVTTWAGGTSVALRAIKESGSRIADTARVIIDLSLPATPSVGDQTVTAA